MAFINIDNLENVSELETAPEGTYDLLVSKVEEKEDKNGKAYLMFTLEFMDHPEYYSIRHFMFLPSEEDDARRRQSTMVNIKRFLTMAGLGVTNNFDPQELLGCTLSNAMVTQTEPNDQGQVFNNLVLRKFS